MLFSQSSHKKNRLIACKFLCLLAVENINTFAAFARVNKPNMHTFSLTHSPPSLSLLCFRNGKCTTECASAPVELLHNGYYLGAARDAQWTSDRKYLASSAHIKQQQTYTESESRVSTQTPESGPGQESTLCHRGTAEGSCLENGQMTLASRAAGKPAGRAGLNANVRMKSKPHSRSQLENLRPSPSVTSLPSHMAPLSSTLIESSVWAAIVVVSSIFCCAQLLAQLRLLLPLLQTVLAAMPEIIKLANL